MMFAHRDDTAAFTALYRETRVDLLAFLLRRCHTAEDAADCLAETYPVAWEKRRRIPKGAEARPWLFGVARNVMRRGHERRGRTASATQALVAELQTAGAVPPASELTDPDPIMTALAQLSPRDQEILTMIAWDGLTPHEVGVALRISANVVRVRAHRARAKVKSALARTAETSTVPQP